MVVPVIAAQIIDSVVSDLFVVKLCETRAAVRAQTALALEASVRVGVVAGHCELL